MKKHIFILAITFLLTVTGIVSAQDLLIQSTTPAALPQLGGGIPDPGEILGGIGSIYQENYQYYDTLYDTYLYPRPEEAWSFVESYMKAAGNAGYTVAVDMVDGYNALRVYPNGNASEAALLFYDYQGYMLFMVPISMDFSLGTQTDSSADAPYLIELGIEAVQNEDYESAIRYLIRAAGSYIHAPEITEEAAPTPTPQPTGPTTYIVQDGDNCWSIAVDRFGVNWELFMQVNGMTACDIGIGDEVIIPGADQQMVTSTPIPLDQYTAGQVISYPVEMNDSYNDIAAKFNTTLESIQRLNNVNVYTSFPQYGQVLQIEVNLITPTPTIEPTETPEVGTLQP
ncbi:MAG: LysM peptidoglycan-binding domain-containing protein [Anaerolineaceae bacterium]|nr:LysM peptidoglycan-binding domain-containing protein [Anaerolineaceae bacterium]